MKALIVLAFLVLIAPANAQQQERNYTLVLNSTQVNLIARALRKLPYEEVVAILEAVGSQVDTQNKIKDKPPEEKPQ